MDRIQKAIADGKFELGDNGILIPSARVLVQGEYRHSVNGQDERIDYNIVTTEFLNYLLNVGLKAAAADSTWFMALFAANYTPVASLTAASFPATASEITSNTEGYTEATRQAWTAGTVASGAVDNYAARATFTIATASSLSVNGAAVLSSSTKGDTTGVIMSAVKFNATRTLYATDTFQTGYRLTFTPV